MKNPADSRFASGDHQDTERNNTRPSTIPVSVLILTKNEEQDLPGCLASVAWSDDVHVFDSYSTDSTVRIAETLGARVTQRTFDNYAAQRNAALHGLSFQHDWVLILDGDERIPKPLAEEFSAFVESPPDGVVAGRIRRYDFWGSSRLKHAQMSQLYIRLVKPGFVHYEREVNEVLKVNGGIYDLKEGFDHHTFSKGLARWIEKHNLYSTLEAKQVVRTRSGIVPFSMRKALLSQDFNERRFHQKEFFYRLPGRPFIKWAYMMVLRRSFLDGPAGSTFALLQAIHEYMIVLKTRELEAEGRLNHQPESNMTELPTAQREA